MEAKGVHTPFPWSPGRGMWTMSVQGNQWRLLKEGGTNEESGELGLWQETNRHTTTSFLGGPEKVPWPPGSFISPLAKRGHDSTYPHRITTESTWDHAGKACSIAPGTCTRRFRYPLPLLPSLVIKKKKQTLSVSGIIRVFLQSDIIYFP